MKKDRVQMAHESTSPKPRGLLILIILAALHFVLHMITNGNYGIFRDEYYYIACADHLDWGYVDQPPLSIALLAASKGLLGDSVHAIRLLAALAGAAVVLLAGLLTAELGGRRFARSRRRR